MLVKKSKKRILAVLLCLIIMACVASFSLNKPSFAASSCGGVETSILDCDSENNGSIREILWNVLDIFSILVGIAGVAGIVVVGIQYMTAGGDEQRVKKSKRRLIEIVLGLVVYILSFAGLKWLGVQPQRDVALESISVPNQNISLTSGSITSIAPAFYPLDADAKINCTSSNPEIIKVTSVGSRTCDVKALKDEGTAVIKVEATQNSGEESEKTATATVVVKATKEESKENTNNKGAEGGAVSKKLNDVATKYAWPIDQKDNCAKPYNGFYEAFKSVGLSEPHATKYGRTIGRSCGQFVSTVYRYSGVDKSLPADSVCSPFFQ